MDPARGAKGFVVTPVSKGGAVAGGQPSVYPSGKPEVAAAILTFEPGGQTDGHRHPIPQYAKT